MTNKRSTVLKSIGMVSGAAWMIGAAGCSHWYGNVFIDEHAGQAAIETTSSRLLRGMGSQASALRRDHRSVMVHEADGVVSHGPLYFEDGFETEGSEDGRFAWTVEDYWAFVWGDARWLINWAAIPASLVMYPPWMEWETGADGVPVHAGLTAFDVWERPLRKPTLVQEGRRHDASSIPTSSVPSSNPPEAAPQDRPPDRTDVLFEKIRERDPDF